MQRTYSKSNTAPFLSSTFYCWLKLCYIQESPLEWLSDWETSKESMCSCWIHNFCSPLIFPPFWKLFLYPIGFLGISRRYFFNVLIHHHLGLYSLNCCFSSVGTEMLGMPPTAQTDHSYRCIQGNHHGDTHMKFVAMTENAASVTHSHVAVCSQRNRASINTAWHTQKSPGGSALQCLTISGFIYVAMCLFFCPLQLDLFGISWSTSRKIEFAEYLLVRVFFITGLIYFRLYSRSGLFFNMLKVLYW